MTTRRHHDELPPVEGALGRLLNEASAPAHPGELDGLSAALTAFHQHHTPARRRSMKAVLTNLIAAKALLALGVASMGGVALAASTGTLPAPAQNVAHDLVGAPAADTGHAQDSQEAQDAQDAQVEENATPKPSASPSPSLIGLCRAYSAGVKDAKGKALESPAFTFLITTAGSKEAVGAYCTTLLATAPGGKPSALPDQAQQHKPSTHPTGKPSEHPTGKPSTHPTGSSGDHATGKPEVTAAP
ncbi:MAG: hypothetical protein JWM40_3020 [Frankiales bacterium]|nr:hypothetical protein [Frankiales bacterium]